MGRQAKLKRERREGRRQWQAIVEQARARWLGKRVAFVDPLDYRAKIGRVVEISDDGGVRVAYLLLPGWSDCPCEVLTMVDGLEEEMTLIDD